MFSNSPNHLKRAQRPLFYMFLGVQVVARGFPYLKRDVVLSRMAGWKKPGTAAAGSATRRHAGSWGLSLTGYNTGPFVNFLSSVNGTLGQLKAPFEESSGQPEKLPTEPSEPRKAMFKAPHLT